MKSKAGTKKGWTGKYDVAAIDIIVNLWTPEANRVRPRRDAFYQGKMKVKRETVEGISIAEMLRRMDSAGIERAFLAATKVGRLGHQACYHLPYAMVAKAVKRHPDRFHALAGLDPWEGMRGVRELEHAAAAELAVGVKLAAAEGGLEDVEGGDLVVRWCLSG